jgi:hypothetical protein
MALYIGQNELSQPLFIIVSPSVTITSSHEALNSHLQPDLAADGFGPVC